MGIQKMVMFRDLNDLKLIKTADYLLDTENNLALIKTIKLLIKSSMRFDYYLPIIKKFAEFVQDIPLKRTKAFKQEISFLERGLQRSTRTLLLCLKYFFPDKTDFESISDSDALWIYAAFTAALFLDIGKLIAKYTLLLYDKNHQLIDEWNFFSVSMINHGYYYKINYIKENKDNLKYSSTPILAGKILDSVTDTFLKNDCLNWIASDKKVLESWIDILSGKKDRIPMTSFMSMIPFAEIDIIEKYRINAPISVDNPNGELFLQWLRKEIENGKIVIGEKNAKVIISNGKILISTVLFEEFAELHQNCESPEVVKNQFINIILQLYQIPISELDQRYRAFGGLSGLNDSSKRYRAVGGISTTQENQKNPPQRFLQGDSSLIFLIKKPPTLTSAKNLINSY